MLPLVATLLVGALWLPSSQLHTRRSPSRARPAAVVCKEFQQSRRPNRVGQVVLQELSSVLRTSSIRGPKPIDGRLRSMISIVNVDMSPDLRQARVKVSIIGDRKDKITAIRWLQGSTGSIRHALAKRVRGMKRVPSLSFQHVDVGQAVDVMITIDRLASERKQSRTADGLDFDDEDEFAGDLEAMLAAYAGEPLDGEEDEEEDDEDGGRLGLLDDDDDDDDVLLHFDESDDEEDPPAGVRPIE